MDRLTTNKDVSEMSMIELAHNCCYAKERKTRYRDYETDIDARELAIKLLDKYVDVPNEFTCDEDFDDFILDSLQYGTDNILGIIAIFYENLWAMADLRECLKEYEDLDEQGKLLKLPCEIGNTVYFVSSYSGICEHEIRKFQLDKNGWYACSNLKFKVSDFGKTVFLTREEAEAALNELMEP